MVQAREILPSPHRKKNGGSGGHLCNNLKIECSLQKCMRNRFKLGGWIGMEVQLWQCRTHHQFEGIFYFYLYLFIFGSVLSSVPRQLLLQLLKLDCALAQKWKQSPQFPPLASCHGNSVLPCYWKIRVITPKLEVALK